MKLITKNIFLDLLNNYKETINIEITGYIQLNLTFKTYKTNLINDTYTITESNSKNSICFNFNEIQNTGSFISKYLFLFFI